MRGGSVFWFLHGAATSVFLEELREWGSWNRQLMGIKVGSRHLGEYVRETTGGR